MVENGSPISKQETFSRLSTAKSIEDIIDIIRYVVGDAWLFIKDRKKLFFISTTLAPPYYFYRIKNEILFTKLESEICKIEVKKGEKISAYDL